MASSLENFHSITVATAISRPNQADVRVGCMDASELPEAAQFPEGGQR
jgi:hypothetical protein